MPWRQAWRFRQHEDARELVRCCALLERQQVVRSRFFFRPATTCTLSSNASFAFVRHPSHSLPPRTAATRPPIPRVHVNTGDEGLLKLFRRAFECLSPGGVFVLEPQPWSSYRQAFRKQKVLGFWRLTACQDTTPGFAIS